MTIAHAASLDTFIGNVNRMIVNPLILFLFALAVAYFLYGMLQFFTNQQNEEKKTAGKQHMIWGVIGMTIMMGVFFVMNLILSTLNIDDIKITDEGRVEKVDLDDYNPTYPPAGD